MNIQTWFLALYYGYNLIDLVLVAVVHYVIYRQTEAANSSKFRYYKKKIFVEKTMGYILIGLVFLNTTVMSIRLARLQLL